MAQFTQPYVGSSTTIDVSSSDWMSTGQIIYHSNGGYYRVSAKPSPTTVTLLNLGYPGNATPGNSITNQGAEISPAGLIGPTPGSILDQYVLTLDDITNGYILLTEAPSEATTVSLEVSGGPFLRYGDDFVMDGTDAQKLIWKNYNVENVLEVGDAISVRYDKKYVYP